MRIDYLKNSTTIHNTERKQQILSFKGNITHSVQKVKLNDREISKISGIHSLYKQLNMIFKTTGDYLNEIFRKNISFIAPIGNSGYVFKNIFQSDDINSLVVEESDNADKNLIFTLGGNKDTAKVVVSKDEAELLTDEDLSDETITSYANEFTKNHDKLFDITYDKENEALSLIKKFLNEKNNCDFSLNSTGKIQDASIENEPFTEDMADIAKVYNLNQGSIDVIEKMIEYCNRLSKIYLTRAGYQRDELNQKSGFIRRKEQNGIIFEDLLTNKNFLLGLTQYFIKPTNQELINFGIFDKKLTEVARFKIVDNGEAKLLVRPNAPKDFAENIEQVLKSEMQQGLYEKLVSKLDTAIYYHENRTAVNDYMSKSCRPLTLEQAVKEMITPKESYTLDINKINTLKRNLESIKEIYRAHPDPAYKWQKIYFPEIESRTQKYMYGRIDEFDINYEFISVDNEECSGLRILTRDKDRNFKQCYIIDSQGNVNKLIIMPKTNNLVQLNVKQTNFSLLDQKAVEDAKLDIIFEKICEDTEAYSEFCRKCIEKMTERRQLSRKTILALAAEYKPASGKNLLEQNPFVNDIYQSRKADIHKEKTKALRKKVAVTKEKTETTRKKAAVTQTNTKSQKKEVVKAAKPKLIKSKQLKKKSVCVKKTTVPKISSKINEVKEQPKVEEQKRIEIPPEDTNVTYDVNPEMLKPNGKFKDLSTISLKDVIEQFDKIFNTPYEERSPHLIHEVLDSGRVFTGRFSVQAPDGAIITVSKVKTSAWVEHVYYSIRILKQKELAYINIDPEDGRIIDGQTHTSKSDFIMQNPLCKNMSDYFAELFAYKPNAERKTMKFQVIKTPRILLAEQAMRDFKAATMTSIPKWVQEEYEKELEE